MYLIMVNTRIICSPWIIFNSFIIKEIIFVLFLLSMNWKIDRKPNSRKFIIIVTNNIKRWACNKNSWRYYNLSRKSFDDYMAELYDNAIDFSKSVCLYVVHHTQAQCVGILQEYTDIYL